MERKVGEIFEYKGKVYQVVEIKTDVNCKGCAFEFDGCNIPFLGDCHPVYRTDKVNIIFKEVKKYMDIKNNQLTINIPEGMEIDVENSDLEKGVIKFKNKELTYVDIMASLDSNTKLIPTTYTNCEKVIAISKLMDIADYYNKGWKPNWNDKYEYKFHITYNVQPDTYSVDSNKFIVYNNIFFKNKEDAQAVINNPNFREILDAIYKN